MVTRSGKPPTPHGGARSSGEALIQNEKLKQLYVAMLRCRMLEERASMLCRQLDFPESYSAAAGHEATEVGCTIDLRAADTIASSRRALISSLTISSLIQDMPRGERRSWLKAFAAGSEPGPLPAARGPFEDSPLPRPPLHARGRMPSREALPGIQLAASVALANKLKKTKNVVVAFSEIASSHGSVEETFRLAGKQALPIVFVSRDKLSPRFAGAKGEKRRKEIALLARDSGFPGIPVDGHDVVAIYRVAHEAIHRARRGDGPTLIECKTYALESCASDGRKTAAAIKNGRKAEKDPIEYMERYLTRKGIFRDTWKNQAIRRFSRELDAAVERALHAPHPGPIEFAL